MKIVIWLGCCFAYGFIVALLRQFGIILGGIPTFILASIAFLTARTLCKKWDIKQGKYVEPEEEDEDSEEETEASEDSPLEWDEEKGEWIEK